jgi:hypothetical protein
LFYRFRNLFSGSVICATYSAFCPPAFLHYQHMCFLLSSLSSFTSIQYRSSRSR